MPTPTTTINLPAEEFINENFEFSVIFDNTSASDVGYGPFFDLVVPDEITLGSANYLDAPITLVEYEWNGTEWVRDGNRVTAHPYDTNLALPTATNAGDKWYLVELPFGSFVPEQPEAEITFSGNTLSYDEGARVGTPLEIQSRGGFRYGDDEFDTPDDAIQEGSTRTSEITPKVIELTKKSDAPEDETATGRNFARTYTLTIDIANGETVENLVLQDFMPNNLVYLDGTLNVTGATVISQTTPTADAPQNSPDNDFAIELGSVTGGTSATDVVITYQAYAPELDADRAEVINSTSGDDELALNESQVTGNYRGTPVSDATTDAVGSDDDAADYTLELKSIAIQKGVSIVGGGDAIPGKVLEYTLDFQISDYFSFKDIKIEDIFSDGQRFDSSFAPTLTISGNDGVVGTTQFENFSGLVNTDSSASGNFSAENLTGTLDTGNANSTGDTTLNFNVSAELLANDSDGVLDADGILVGDESGFGNGTRGSGGTTGRLVYRTIIQENFSDRHNGLPGDESVDLDDVLRNDVTISGTIVDDDGSTLQDEADESNAGVVIASPTKSKTIYAIDGDTNVPANPTLTPGQTVTYRLTMELPAADAENLIITDFLPLPVFDALEIPDGGVAAYSGTPPAAGTVSFGPTHTLDLSALNSSLSAPTVDSTGGSANTLAINFGTFDDANSQPATIDLLLTVTATDAPFADGLYLTNQAQSQTGNTEELKVTDATEIIQIELTQPELKLTKGVVSEDNPNDGTFDPGAPSAFAAPGSGTSYTGGINSNNLSTANIDSNLSGVDAGDLVTFAIVVENTGGSGAFDLLIQDAIPVDGDGNPQFQLPTGGAGLNLQVFNGDGSTVSFTGDLFSGGISIDDDANGVIDKGRDGNTKTGDGSNLLIITYDLEVLSTVEANQPLTSEAQVLEYSAVEGGHDFTTNPNDNSDITNDNWVDPATVTIDTPEIAKTLVGTDVTGTNNSLADEATIGETLTYQIQLTVPEGVMNNAQIVDTLDRGLEFISLDSVSLTSGSGVTTSLGNNAIDTANFSTSTSGNFSNRAGQQVTIDLGTLTNLDTTNTTPEVITLEYTVRVADINNNRAGRERNNSAEIVWDRSGATPIEDSAQNVTIVEPVLDITNAVVVQTPGNPADTDNRGDAGDDVTYTVTITHTGGPEAFEAALSNQLPDALDLGSATIDSVTTGIAGVDASDFEITAGGLLQSTNPFDIPVGESVTVTVTGTLANTVSSGGTSDSQAFVTWTSLDGDVAAERTSYSDNSTTSIEVFAPEPIKSIVSTSEDHTTGSDVAVGEIVRYRLVVQLSEGTDTDFHLRDNMPDGLQFINDSTTKIAILDVSGTNLTVESGLTGALVAASDPTSITPTFDLPGDRISTSHTTNEDTYNSGTDVVFQLGDITNTGENSGSEFVVLEFNALVVNEAGVQALDNSDTSGGTADATDLDNTFSVFANDSTFTTAISTSDPVTVSVVEPVVDLSATIQGDQPSDAGDQFTYRLTVTNNGDAEAFDLVLTDALGNTVSDTFTELVSITPVGSVGSSTITDTNTAGNTDITLGIDSLAVGQTLTFDVVVELTEDVGPGQVITNDADITYTSLPGDGTASNATGSDPTSVATERDDADGSGGALDDFADTASVSTDPLDTPTITKAITGTSEAATGTAVDVAGNEDVAIGEIVTYQLTVTVPEGTTDGLVITDQIPDGLQLIGTPTLETTGFSGTVGSLTPSGGGSNGEDVTFSLGQIVADSTAGTADNTFTIEYQAVVLDVPSNDNDTAPLGDRATFQFTNPNDGSTVTNQDVDGEPEVDVVVPDLNITQTLTINGTPEGSGDAGDTVTIRLEVENTGDATAYEVALNDLLDETKFDIGSATATTTPAGFSFSNSTGTAGEVTFSGGDISLTNGTPLVFEFTVPLLDAVEPGETLTSEANITEATTLDGNPPAGVTERDIADPDIEANDQSLTITSPTLATRLVETEINNGNNDNTEAAIGELVTYELTLTIPEGTTAASVLRDTLDPGLAFVGFTSINLGGVTSTTIDDTTDLLADLTTNTNITNDGSDIEIDFGTLTNTGDNVLNQTITIQYQAVVENIATNQGDGSETPSTLNNDPSFSWNNGTVQTIQEATPSDNITVIEPDLQIVKDVVVDGSGTAGDGGDSVVYTITIQHTGDSTADAFDLNLSDTLPPEFVPDGSPLSIGAANTATAAVGDFEIAAGNTLQLASGSNIDLALGEVLVLQISGTLPDTVESGDSPDSTATVTWTSLDGDVSDRSPHTTTGDEERTGAGGDNDYTASDNAEFTITGAPTIATELVGSQLDNGVDNGNADAVPGELVTFRTTITVPEGTTSGVVLQETLDAGLAFVEITNISTPQGDVTGGFDFTDEAAANTAAAVGTNGSDFTLNLGNVVNAASSDGSPETIVIEYTAVVLNNGTNQSTAHESGPTLNNTATLDWTNNPTAGTPISATSAEEVSVVEPQLQVIKEVVVNGSGTEGDAGDPVVYTITIQHTGNSEADAFDVNLTDVLPAGFVPDADAISVTNDTTGNSIQDSDFEIGGGNTLQLATGSNIDIPEDTLITLTVTGTLADSVQSGEEINSPAEITWTSIDGDATDLSTSTRNGDEERTGADGDGAGLNNYAHSDDAPATVTGDISIAKSITDTSEPDGDTSGTNVAIGEVVTYQIAVTIPEGSTEGIVVTDHLPDGMQLTGTPTVITDDLNGSVSALTTTGGTSSGDPITFNIDTATATGDNDTGNNTFIIEYQAVVLDEPGNVDTTPLTGDAQLVHNDAEGNPITTPIEAPTEPTVTVVEPELTIVQTLELNGAIATNNDDVVPNGDAGDTVTITLDVSNNGTGGAFEVEIQDLLDPAKFDLSTVNFVTTPDGTGNVNADGISYTGVDVAVGETQQFVFTVELNDGVSPGETLNNIATIVEGNTIDETPTSGVERDIADPDIDSNPEALIINGPMLQTRLVQTAIDNPNNGNTEAVIGELATYELTLTIPEGTTPSAVLNDALDSGLAFVEFTSIELNGITSTTVSNLASLNTNTTVGTDGTGFNINLGDLLNAGDQDGNQSITIQYTAVVLNDAANQGETPSALNNDSSFSWNGGTDTIDDPVAPSEEISVVEPQLTIQTQVLEDPSTPQENVRRNIGDTVRVRLTLSSDDADAFGADAYDVALSNALPPGVTFAGNLAHVSGVALNAGTLTEAGGTVSAVFDEFPDGGESVIEFDVTLDGTVTAGDITDTAQITYSSVPGDPGTISTHNTASTERTGDGGLNDYFDDDPASITVNQPPETVDAQEFVAPSETINVLNMGGNDTHIDDVDGTVDEYRIDTLPAPEDGILYLGNPATGGTPINVNDIIPAAQIGNLYFEATPGFDGGEFTYSAIDNEGGVDLTPNTVTLTPNIRPETDDAVDRVPPQGTINVEGMGGSDPDGTVVEYEIASLPGDGILFLGDPASGGTPVQVGDRIPAADIDDLHFTASPGFTGTSFTYSSVDNEGATDLTPATVTIDSNPRPDTDDVINNVPLSSNVPLTGLIGPLGGSDPNGTVDEYRIVSVPDPADGVLYLGDPAYGGTPLSANDTVPAGQINNLFFQSTGTFDGATFQYAAIDNEDAEDLTPATVTLNAPPETIDSSGTVPPNGTIPIENLGGSDPDTMVQFYTIDSLPPAADGTLYLGSATPGNEVQVGDNLTPMELGQLFFTASPTFTGDTTFTYHATDDLGLPDPTPATVTITSIDGNIPPETVDNLQTIEPGTTVPLPVPPGSDFDGTVTGYQIDTLPDPVDGVLSLNGTPVTEGQIIPNNQIGNLVFEATPGFDGGEFTYSAVDNEGDADPTPATYTLNAPPTTEDVDDRVNPDDTLPLTALIGNDPDGTVTSYTIDTLPPAADGVLYLGDPAAGGTPVTVGQVIPAGQIADLFFTASGTFTGTSFTYSATDDRGIPDATPATVMLTPDGVNLAPQTENVEDTVDPGDTLNLVGLMGSDPDGTVEEFRIDTLPEPEDGILYLGDPERGGTPINLNDIIPAAQIGNLYFEATPEFDGTTFTYSAIDDLDEADPSPATVTLNPTNTPPETEDGIQTVQPGSPNLLDVPGGTDDDGTVTGYTIDTLPDPADGILYIGDPSLGNTVSAGQALTPTQLEQLVFVAEPGFDGGEFTYSAIDNDGVTDPTPATFTLNAPPQTDNFTGNVNPNNIINLTSLGGSDPDVGGSVVSYTIDTLPPAADGILYLGDPAAGGTPVTAGQVIPAADLGDLFFEASGTFTGTSFTYSATDNTGADDPTPATVNLIPDGANVPPTTEDVEDTVAPGDTLNIPDMGGDDPDGTVDEYRIDTLPAAEDGILYLGDPAVGGTPVNPGDVIPAADIENLFFEATPEFDGSSFTYTAIDNEGDEDPTPATVTLNVPPETDDGAQEVTPGTAATLIGLGGDDLDGTVEGFRIDSLPPLVDGVLYLGSIAPGNEIFPGQVLTPAQIDRLVFDATNDFDGASFTYSAIDNDRAVDPTPATFDLVPPNEPPNTDDVTDNVAPEETINLTGLGGDDTDGTIAYYTITSLPPGEDGILYIGDPEVEGIPVEVGDVLTPEQIEQLHFTASSTYTGTSFTYAAADDDGASDPTPGTVTLGLGNLPPETDDAINEVTENSTTQLTGLGGNDPDGTIDFYTIQTLPNEGSLYLGNPASGGTPVSIGQTLTPFEITNLYFEAPIGYSGDSNFNYIATDEDGEEDPTPATVFLPTPGANLPPDTEDTSATALPEETIQLTGLGGDDVDGGTVEGYEIQSLPTVGTLYVDDPVDGLTEVNVGDVIPPDLIDDLFYEAPTGFTGDTTFEYAAIDNDGAIDPTPGTVTISALSDNVPPETDNASTSVPPGGSVSVPGLGGDDSDGTVALYQINTLPSQGTLYIGNPSLGVTVTPGQILTPTQLEQLVFQAPPGFRGSSFTYSAIDNEGGIDPTPATVALTPTLSPVVNRPPDTTDADVEANPGETVSIPGLGGEDPDGTVTSYTIGLIPPASEGILYLGDPENGGTPVNPGDTLTPEELAQLVFVAGENFTGTSFEYFATDNRGANDPTPATVTIGIPGEPTEEPEPTPAIVDSVNEEVEEPTNPEPETHPSDPNCVDCCPDAPELEGVYVAPPEALPGAPVPPPPTFDSTAFIPVPETIFNGTTGNDSLEGTSANDELQGFEGDDRLEGSNGDDLIVGGISSPVPVGNTRDRDYLAGNQGRDFIAASEGNDTVYGGENADVVLAGKDNDRVWGDRGDDTLLGELGDDTISGDSQDLTDGELSGQDLIYGGAGNDRLNGNEKNDTISGGDGDDFARGGQDDDLVYGDGGNDVLYGDYGNDTLLGSLGSNAPIGHDDERDLLYGNQGRDLLKGGQGDDSLYAGQQDDRVYGGKDDDLILGELGSDTLSGDLGDDTIRGGTGDSKNPDLDGRDLIYGGAGNDAIYANEGDDTITAGHGHDLARGGQNNDLMFGDGGNDTLHGEYGDDTILGSLGSTASANADDEQDLLYGNQGSDLIKGGQGKDTVYAGKHRDLVYGGKDGDLIFGDQGSDTLSGDLGDDTIIGGTGNPSNPEEDTASDVIFGGDGRDLMDGNLGDDTIVSGSGNDIAFGGRGDDIIWGEAGNDFLFGDLGNDTLCGGDGDDMLVGSNGNPNSTNDGDDRLCGGAGNDSLFGNDSNDTLVGEDGDDCMFGGQGDDTLKGGTGNDLLVGDRGNDLLIGGSGSDVFVLRVGDGSDVITDFEVGVDLLGLADGLTFDQLTITQGTTGTVVSFGAEVLVTLNGVSATSLTATSFTNRFKGQEPDEHDCPDAPTLEGATVEPIPAFTLETTPEIENLLIGTAGNDGIIGSDGNDSIRGLAGNDRADGEAGDDVLVGGLSSAEPVGSDMDRDTLYGNQGNDVIFGSEGEDFLYGGKDGDVILGGKDNDQIEGEIGDDTLAGEWGDDRIFGGTGDADNPDTGRDLIYGGLGNDELYGNQGNDSISGGYGDDIAFGGKEDDLISGEYGNDTLEGEQGNDTILGSLGSSSGIGSNGDRDWLSGNIGNDLIKGGEGEDTVYAGKDDDLVYGGKDNDVIYGDLGRDTLSGDLGDDTISGGTGVNSNLEGEADADVIFGGAGNDLIDGNLGNDSLVAGTGNDTVSGGRQDDVIWGEAGDDLLFGDLGNDTVCGGEGNDTLIGSNGNPLNTNDGDDKLCGGAGNDVVFGNEGNDRLSGDAGDDVLLGGQGDDTLTGGSGSDVLSGEQGNDVLTGGAGVDRFDFAANYGVNLITDFQDGFDRIGLQGGLTPDQLEIIQVDEHTQITASDLMIVLSGVNASSIGADDFSIL